MLPVIAALVVGGGLAIWMSEPTWYLRLRYPLEHEQIVRGHAENYRLEPQLLAAVIYQESKFDTDARSSSGAVGLMQLLPDTAKGIALRTGGSKFVVDDLLDPEINVRYGAWYLRHLLDKYDDERLALAAYNAGQTNVDQWVDEGRETIPFAETRHYVNRVEELKEIYAEAYAGELGIA
jgi:soluble lytic murein transglycosylase